MKKISLEAILSLLTDTNALPEIREEIKAELNKSKAKAEANKALYAGYHTRVMDTLRSSTMPLTAQDIADETGIARGKLVYGLSNYWSDEVVKDTTGKTTTYRIA